MMSGGVVVVVADANHAVVRLRLGKYEHNTSNHSDAASNLFAEEK